MNRLAYFVVLLSACFPRVAGVNCTSDAGALLVGSVDCSGFQAAENRMRTTFGVFAPVAKLRGTVVRVIPGKSFKYKGQDVAGLTWCHGTIELADLPWREGAYAHEMVHLAECPASDYDHAGWADKGYWQFIDDANAAP